jgi:hypothetical protein
MTEPALNGKTVAISAVWQIVHQSLAACVCEISNGVEHMNYWVFYISAKGSALKTATRRHRPSKIAASRSFL